MSKSATKKHSYTHKIRMAVNRNKKHNADKKAGQKPNPKKKSIEIKSVDRGCTCNNLDNNCSVQFVNRSHTHAQCDPKRIAHTFFLLFFFFLILFLLIGDFKLE